MRTSRPFLERAAGNSSARPPRLAMRRDGEAQPDGAAAERSESIRIASVAPPALALFDSEDRLVECNAAYAALLGDAEEAAPPAGTSFETIVRRQVESGQVAGGDVLRDPAAWIAKRLELRRRGERVGLELQLSDGRRMDVIEERLDGGLLLEIWIDVTIRVKHMSALEDLVQGVGEGLALWDQADRLVAWNPAFAAAHGSPDWQPRPGDSFTILVQQSDQVFEAAADSQEYLARRLGRKLDADAMTVRHRDGRWFIIRERRSNAGGTVTSVADVTELKLKELALAEHAELLGQTVQQLEMAKERFEEHGASMVEWIERAAELQERVERGLKIKKMFLSKMSHDLRTPLNAILGFSDVMRGELLGPMVNRRYIDYASDIHGAAQHLMGLINQILEFDQIENGTMNLQRRAVALTPLIERVCRMVSPIALHAGVAVELAAPPELPAVVADELAVERVMTNLLTNAIKFSPSGSKVLVNLDAERQAVRVLVRDQGSGIPAEDLERVMLPFEQGQSDPYLARRGSGLGLPIAKSLVELHGGRFELHSAPGSGTEVEFTLPAIG